METTPLASRQSTMVQKSLPSELIEEILIRLPSRSRARFKSLSKTYYAFISGHSYKPCMIVGITEGENVADQRLALLSLPTSSYQAKQEMVLSCGHERIFYRFARGFVIVGIGETRVYVVNPITRQQVLLPLFEKNQEVVEIYLAIDDVRKVLKVVAAVSVKEDEIEYFVCRLAGKDTDKKWDQVVGKNKSCVSNMYHPHCGDEAVCIDRIMYFGAWSLQGDKNSVIGRFDVVNEVLDFVSIPNQGDDNDSGYYVARNLFDYNGRLASIVRKLGYGTFRGFTLWLSDDSSAGFTWTQQDLVFPPVPEWIEYLSEKIWSFPGTSDKGEIIFAPLNVREVPLTLVFYDVKKNEFRKQVVEGVDDALPFARGKYGYSRIFFSQHQHDNTYFVDTAPLAV